MESDLLHLLVFLRGRISGSSGLKSNILSFVVYCCLVWTTKQHGLAAGLSDISINCITIYGIEIPIPNAPVLYTSPPEINHLRCGRAGDRPLPAAGNRFPDRATARAAARATEQYRSALRRYDPQV